MRKTAYFAVMVGSVVASPVVPRPLVGAEVQRLPPILLPHVQIPLASATRLPPVSSPDAVELDDVVQLAGGAVELRVRQGWWIWEVPSGREVRVAMSPSRPTSFKKTSKSGYWVCYHLQANSSGDPRQYLAERMRQRLLEVSRGMAQPLHSVQFYRFDGWDAAEQEFLLPSASGSVGAANHGPAMQGSHVLVNTPWGLFEFHAQFPVADYQTQLSETARLLQHVKLAAPSDDVAGPATPSAQAAAPIHGAWKAFRSRMRLSPGGDIEIATDRAQVISPPAEARQENPPELLVGQYRAEGDLLFVQWRDGSKLNFRWKLNGRDLLLTDHDGQISQLRRIVE